MRELGFDGLSEDKRFIIIRDPDSDEQFRVRLEDEAVDVVAQVTSRQSASSDASEAATMTTLTPRDIQTRVRRGASPQEIADASGMAMAQIEAFAGPVLAEREYMVEQARKAAVRRKHVTGAGARLGSLVDDGVARLGQSPESCTWDSFRRDDGRWAIVVTVPDQEDLATYVYDVQSRYVVAQDDFAHELVDDVAAPVNDRNMDIADAVRDNSTADAVRDNSTADAVRDDDFADDGDEGQPFVDEAPISEDAADEAAPDLLSALESDEAGEPTAALELPPDIAAAEALLDAAQAYPGVRSLKEARERRAQEAMAAAADVVGEEPPPRTDDRLEESVDADVAVPDQPSDSGKKRHERRRVPSWDEIMFGGSND